MCDTHTLCKAFLQRLIYLDRACEQMAVTICCHSLQAQCHIADASKQTGLGGEAHVARKGSMHRERTLLLAIACVRNGPCICEYYCGQMIDVSQ